MDAGNFPYQRFNWIKAEKEKAFLDYIKAEKVEEVPILVTPPCDIFGVVAGDRVRSLQIQLDSFEMAMRLDSDFMISYLEPWHGVGVYASMFGCPVAWSTFDAPQTLPVLHSIDEVESIKKPDPLSSEMSRMVLDTITYFRQQTADRLDIVLTDTQSPNDTASLIMDTAEFFAYNRLDPNRLDPLLKIITDLIIEFSEMQFEKMGDTRCQPGHIMLSCRGLPGISISDDNMSFLSVPAYRDCALKYNNRLARHFRGISIHTCGNFIQNYAVVQEHKNLMMMDCAVEGVDPNPNQPAKLASAFANTGILLKVRMGAGEDFWWVLDDLVRPDLKLILQIASDGDIEKSNRIFRNLKKRCKQILAEKT